MIECHDLESNLIDFLEGSIDNAKRSALESHLEECAACRDLVASYGSLWESINSAEQSQPSLTLWRNLQTKINLLETYRPSRLPLLSQWRPVVSLSLRGISIAGAILCGVYLGYGPTTAASSDEAKIVEYYASSLSHPDNASMSEAYDDLDALDAEGAGK